MNQQKPLANKLKTLRLSKKLSAARLAQEVRMSHSIIGYYEDGTRTPSVKALESISKVLNADLEELKRLRDIQKSSSDTIPQMSEVMSEETAHSILHDADEDDDLEALIEHIKNMDKNERSIFIKELEEKLYASALNKLEPFTLKKLQEEIMQIKSEWYTISEDSGEVKNRKNLKEFHGGIVLDEDKPYFYLSYRKIGVEVSFIFNEKQHVQFFTDWFGAEPTATWTVTGKVPHLPKPVKLVKNLWLDPKVSPNGLFKASEKYNLPVDLMKFNSYFEWQVTNLIRYNSSLNQKVY